jgi:alkyl hydroperoxide reductase subunit AhpC
MMPYALIAVALMGRPQDPRPVEPVQIGQVAPPVVAMNIDGNIHMQRYYNDRFVLLTFWSMDDPASKRQFEELKKIRRTLAKQDRVLILSVCTDEEDEATWDRWRHFLEGQGDVDYGDRDRPGGGSRFTFYMDHKWVNAFQETANFSTTKAYGVKRVPEAFLIGPDRRLRAIKIPTDKMGAVVAEALKDAP